MCFPFFPFWCCAVRAPWASQIVRQLARLPSCCIIYATLLVYWCLSVRFHIRLSLSLSPYVYSRLQVSLCRVTCRFVAFTSSSPSRQPLRLLTYSWGLRRPKCPKKRKKCLRTTSQKKMSTRNPEIAVQVRWAPCTPPCTLHLWMHFSLGNRAYPHAGCYSTYFATTSTAICRLNMPI